MVVGTDAEGRIASLLGDDSPEFSTRADDVELGTVVPGMGDAHSHAFHRVLRGRTHADGGDFWQWRRGMYQAAAALDPDLYRELALGVFGEMVAAGWTAVGEFHYVHHRRDGSPYDPPHAMELALASAAEEVGIRLVLLDTLYLDGGVDTPLSADQRRFGDASAERWLERWHSLREAIAGYSSLVTLGAAVHSTRAVPPAALAAVAAGLPADVPLHVHLSEQPQENSDVRAGYGVTPTRLLADAGLLTPRLSVVHATHLTPEDIGMLGHAGVFVVMCPTTEADLGDGIGPARALADAGARIALGSDQNAVVDPFLEMRGLEAGERLASGRRGRFAPAELWVAAGTAGYAALGLAPVAAVGCENRRISSVDPRSADESAPHATDLLQSQHLPLTVGAWADFVEIDTGSVRTVGSDPAQLPLSATASDVLRVVVGGRVVADRGVLTGGAPQPAEALDRAIIEIGRRSEGAPS